MIRPISRPDVKRIQRNTICETGIADDISFSLYMTLLYFISINIANNNTNIHATFKFVANNDSITYSLIPIGVYSR